MNLAQLIKDLKCAILAQPNVDWVEWCRQSDVLTLDNHTVGEPRPIGPGALPIPTDDIRLEMTMSNGLVQVHAVPGYDASSAYSNRWAHINSWLSKCLSAAKGSTTVKTQANGNEYGNAGPDGNPLTPWGAFGWADCCPGDIIPIRVKSTTIGGRRDGRVIYLPLSIQPGTPERFWQCITKQPDGTITETWQAVQEDGTTVAIEGRPEGCLYRNCEVPAHPQFAAVPDCPTTNIGPVCEISPTLDADGNPVLDGDGNPAFTVITRGVFISIEDCDGVRTVVPYTLDDNDDVVPHELGEGNYYGDCATGAAVEEPPAVVTPTWHTADGWICDQSDDRYGESVCWVQGIDQNGQTVYPGGSKCPTFLPGKLNTAPTPQGRCLQSVAAIAWLGRATDTITVTDDGHTASFTMGQSGTALLNQINNQIGSNFQLCTYTIGGLRFVIDTRTVTVNTAGNVTTVTSTQQNDVAGCEAAYSEAWNNGVEGADAEFAGGRRSCRRFQFRSSGDPIPADCTAPLDPQPTQVAKGAAPDPGLADLCDKQDATNALLQQIVDNTTCEPTTASGEGTPVKRATTANVESATTANVALRVDR